ncbi:hypothetical protein BT63DRAFT_456252 [Microthyrium microscopicum]|uniref:Uncharacterized protein n=1 Tax=Microthyrium microscopicum TaxID=703497 RepID=A0A6A6U8M6_9PEZI|nr:hypothetical protein BT63DRAFT_456252 [Microthyrium microscopicum]
MNSKRKKKSLSVLLVQLPLQNPQGEAVTPLYQLYSHMPALQESRSALYPVGMDAVDILPFIDELALLPPDARVRWSFPSLPEYLSIKQPTTAAH